MARYINADIAADRLKFLTKLHSLPNWVRDFAVDIIEKTPTVDAAPVVHSEWIPVDDGDPGDEKCKRCGCYHHVWEAFGYYCQHCGAKMDGGRDNGSLH